jgi:hypothetical protein
LPFRDYQKLSILGFVSFLVGNGKFFSAFGSTACKHSSAVGGCHSFAKAVLVAAFSIGGLISPFHKYPI